MSKSSPFNLRLHKKPGHAALRRGRASVSGQRYLVTFTTHGRQALFSSHAIALDAAREIHDRRSWQKATLLAWVLMPDHWHGLVELGEDESLPDLMRVFKANVSRRLRLHWPELGPVWGKSFHDRALRREEDAIALARYIVLNPVRAGLVCKIGDYPFWNAVWL
ncbi:REP-associated tyrosine transposase [Pseudoxanthomonas sacheonensis]|uniref:REP-associated tyrosine transposase n=1 Tax=Pseudoxanthomonas sacheonensis TaxID=443615 RepID=UPI002483FC17|nr:transposase [Pseudoxanthomonas sacheonensis]